MYTLSLFLPFHYTYFSRKLGQSKLIMQKTRTMYKPDPAISAAGRPLEREPLPDPLFGEVNKTTQCCKSTSHVSVKRRKIFRGSFSEKSGHDCTVPILITEFLFCSGMGTQVGGSGTRCHGSASGQCWQLFHSKRMRTLPVTKTSAMHPDVPDKSTSKHHS